jgi:hypothetical protein
MLRVPLMALLQGWREGQGRGSRGLHSSAPFPLLKGKASAICLVLLRHQGLGEHINSKVRLPLMKRRARGILLNSFKIPRNPFLSEGDLKSFSKISAIIRG